MVDSGLLTFGVDLPGAGFYNNSTEGNLLQEHNMEAYHTQAPTTDAKDDPQARELLRRAFEKTARWPADFKGFTADLTLNVDGTELKGSVTVKSPQEVTVNLDHPEYQKWAANTIGMIAVHRGPRTFDQSDGKSVLTLDRGASHPMGQTVHIHDNLKSHYRIKDDRITQINRTMGPMKFTINVEDSTLTQDNKYLTTRYTVYYFSPQDGKLTNVESFADSHVRVGKVDLPGLRRIISAENGTVTVKNLTFSNHQLL
jgi:uncharacterized lipoprotein NlpE involved in copper resistance